MNKKIEKILSYKEVTKVLQEKAVSLPNLVLSNRNICDIELILNGAFNPLKSFMDKDDYENVLNNMRLKNNVLWPIPITLDVSKQTIEQNNYKKNKKIALRDKEGFLIALMTIGDIWKVDKDKEAKCVYGTKDLNHPGVKYLFTNAIYLFNRNIFI